MNSDDYFAIKPLVPLSPISIAAAQGNIPKKTAIASVPSALAGRAIADAIGLTEAQRLTLKTLGAIAKNILSSLLSL